MKLYHFDTVDIALADSGHAMRVSVLSEQIAARMQLPLDSVLLIGAAALLHDVGKVAIPAQILQKQRTLTPTEREIMEQHCKIGSMLIRSLPDRCLFNLPYEHRREARRLAARIALEHHERLDGSGYLGLCGYEIKLP